jgi:adenylosuccinate synthase
MTKLDVLDEFDTIKLCVGYKMNGCLLELLPPGATAAAKCEPIYESFAGWRQSTAGIRTWDDLPLNARQYLQRIEAITGVPIDMISTGPDRDETILLRHPFNA